MLNDVMGAMGCYCARYVANGANLVIAVMDEDKGWIRNFKVQNRIPILKSMLNDYEVRVRTLGTKLAN